MSALPIHRLEGNQFAGATNVLGERVGFCRHVIDRYRERVKPALSLHQALADFRLLASSCGTYVVDVEWASRCPGGEQGGLGNDTTMWLMLGDDIAISLIASPGGGWYATTCLTRSTISDKARTKRNARRRRHTAMTAKAGRVREGRARARAKAMSEQEDRWAA